MFQCSSGLPKISPIFEQELGLPFFVVANWSQMVFCSVNDVLLDPEDAMCFL